MKTILFLSALFLLLPWKLYSQSAENLIISEPWEQGDFPKFKVTVETPRFESPSIRLIRYYQTSISVNSVSRCPFFLSCSEFTVKAIERHGFFKGTALFLDRAYFREHEAAWGYYPFRVKTNGAIKLNDEGYLD